MSIGNMIKERRNQIGMTQVECARRANIDAGSLCKIESGKTIPRADTIELICDALNVKLAFKEK